MNQTKGYWVDEPTFNFTGFKLAVAKGCEYQLLTERKYSKDIEIQREDYKKQLNTLNGVYRTLNDSYKQEQQEHKIEIKDLTTKVEKVQSSKFKAIAITVGLGVLGIFTTWVTNK